MAIESDDIFEVRLKIKLEENPFYLRDYYTIPWWMATYYNFNIPIGLPHIEIAYRKDKSQLLTFRGHPIDCIWFLYGDDPEVADKEAQEWMMGLVDRRIDEAVDRLKFASFTSPIMEDL